MEPTTGGDTIGDVHELVRAENGNKVLENGGLDEIRMQFGHTVDLMRTNDREVCHSDHLRLTLFDNRHPAK